MSLKRTLRLKVCRLQMTPNYPVIEVTQWALSQGIDNTRLLQELNELQCQLDGEAEKMHALFKSGDTMIVQQEYWCFYCEQLRAHYRMLVRQSRHCL